MSQEKTKISLPGMVTHLEQSKESLGLVFDFYTKCLVDADTCHVIGSFNRLGSGKVYIDPAALVTIRARLEERCHFSASDKMVKDALVLCYDKLREGCFKLPEWLTGGDHE